MQERSVDGIVFRIIGLHNGEPDFTIECACVQCGATLTRRSVSVKEVDKVQEYATADALKARAHRCAVADVRTVVISGN